MNYFMKWIEEIPTRKTIDFVIIQFIETNILSRFGCPPKIITDNDVALKSKKMVEFCEKYHITLGHSTAYYPQGNGLVESSNKYSINIIKNVLEWRISQMIHLQQTRVEVFQNTSKLHESIKNIYDNNTKEDNFNMGDLVLRWDAQNKEKGKHSKFENLWKGPSRISAFKGKNA
eukprot:PITA_36068